MDLARSTKHKQQKREQKKNRSPLHYLLILPFVLTFVSSPAPACRGRFAFVFLELRTASLELFLSRRPARSQAERTKQISNLPISRYNSLFTCQLLPRIGLARALTSFWQMPAGQSKTASRLILPLAGVWLCANSRLNPGMVKLIIFSSLMGQHWEC